MSRAAWLSRPPWRSVIPATLVVVVLAAAYGLWTPGSLQRDGRLDRGRNAIWLQHGWLGADDWFERQGRSEQRAEFRDERKIEELLARLAARRIVDLFPHVSPTRSDGELSAVDPEQVERFVLVAQRNGQRVIPWIGGVLSEHCRPDDAAWRARFTSRIVELLQRHQNLAGVHINIEPWPSGNRDLLRLLDELRPALPPGRVLSIAAYPPPTIWHRHTTVHWNEPYFRDVAGRVDQLAVMMYDTSLRWPKFYQSLMADWTAEVLAWSDGTPVLLGLPAYEDHGAGYHHPQAENLYNALAGVTAGIERFERSPEHYQGVALYSEWTLDENEWGLFERHVLGRARTE